MFFYYSRKLFQANLQRPTLENYHKNIAYNRKLLQIVLSNLIILENYYNE